MRPHGVPSTPIGGDRAMSESRERLAASIRDGMSAMFGLSDQAEMIADGIADAGWVSPEEHRAAVDAYVERLRVMKERAEKAERERDEARRRVSSRADYLATEADAQRRRAEKAEAEVKTYRRLGEIPR